MRNSKKIGLKFVILIFISFFTPTTPMNTHHYNLNLNSPSEDSWATIIKSGHEIHDSKMYVNSSDIYIVGHLGDFDTFVVKYNSSGIKLWEIIWPGPGIEEPTSVTFDSENNLYISGITQAGYNHPNDIFLLKITHFGELLWSKILNPYNNCFNIVSKSALNDSLYISGYNYEDENDEIFLIKLNNSGDILWNSEITVPRSPSKIELYLDSKNDIVLCGGDYSSDIYVVKYNHSGSILWYREINETLGISKLDPNNTVLVSSITEYTSNSSYDAWITKINSSGSIVNKTKLGNFIDYQDSRWWYLDNYNNVYLLIANFVSTYLFKFNSNLIHDWNCSLPNYYSGRSMSVETVSDPHKNIYLYSSSSYYSRYADITVLKINSSGEVLSNYKWGGQYNDACNNLEIDSQDNLYMICRSEYRDQWGLNFYRNILVKNPKPDGKPPVLDMRFSYFDEFLLSFMGIMSVVSIFTLFSIIIKKSKGKLPK